MYKLSLTAGLCLLIAGLASSSRLVCYFNSLAENRLANGRFKVANIDPNKCTHLIFAFSDISSENALVPTRDRDLNLYDSFNALKARNPLLKTLLAVGGITFNTQKFITMVSTPENRTSFIESTVTLLRNSGFDGLNLDWRFPGKAGSQTDSKEKLTLLIKELNAAFEMEGSESGRERLILTASVSAEREVIMASYEIAEIAKHLDFINVLTFDFHGPWENVTGHHSPLHQGSQDTGDKTNSNTEDAMLYWVEQGAPASKLNMGLATYGRSFTLSSQSTAVGAPISGPGEEGCYTGEDGFWAYYEICLYIDGGAIQNITDQKVPYAITENQWVGYDNEASFEAKVRYLQQNEFGGAFIWSLDLDDFSGKFCNSGKCPLTSQLHQLLVTDFPITTPTTTTPMTTTPTTTTSTTTTPTTTTPTTTSPTTTTPTTTTPTTTTPMTTTPTTTTPTTTTPTTTTPTTTTPMTTTPTTTTPTTTTPTTTTPTTTTPTTTTPTTTTPTTTTPTTTTPTTTTPTTTTPTTTTPTTTTPTTTTPTTTTPTTTTPTTTTPTTTTPTTTTPTTTTPTTTTPTTTTPTTTTPTTTTPTTTTPTTTTPTTTTPTTTTPTTTTPTTTTPTTTTPTTTTPTTTTPTTTTPTTTTPTTTTPTTTTPTTTTPTTTTPTTTTPTTTTPTTTTPTTTTPTTTTPTTTTPTTTTPTTTTPTTTTPTTTTPTTTTPTTTTPTTTTPTTTTPTTTTPTTTTPTTTTPTTTTPTTTTPTTTTPTTTTPSTTTPTTTTPTTTTPTTSTPGTTTSDAETSRGVCAGRNSGLVSNPKDDTSFFNCGDQVVHIQFCQPGLIFRESCQCCDFP